MCSATRVTKPFGNRQRRGRAPRPAPPARWAGRRTESTTPVHPAFGDPGALSWRPASRPRSGSRSRSARPRTASDTLRPPGDRHLLGLRPLPTRRIQVVVRSGPWKTQASAARRGRCPRRGPAPRRGAPERRTSGWPPCLADHRGGVLDHRPQECPRPARARTPNRSVAVDLRRKLRREAGPGVRAGNQTAVGRHRRASGHGSWYRRRPRPAIVRLRPREAVRQSKACQQGS